VSKPRTPSTVKIAEPMYIDYIYNHNSSLSLDFIPPNTEKNEILLDESLKNVQSLPYKLARPILKEPKKDTIPPADTEGSLVNSDFTMKRVTFSQPRLPTSLSRKISQLQLSDIPQSSRKIETGKPPLPPPLKVMDIELPIMEKKPIRRVFEPGQQNMFTPGRPRTKYSIFPTKQELISIVQPRIDSRLKMILQPKQSHKKSSSRISTGTKEDIRNSLYSLEVKAGNIKQDLDEIKNKKQSEPISAESCSNNYNEKERANIADDLDICDMAESIVALTPPQSLFEFEANPAVNNIGSKNENAETSSTILMDSRENVPPPPSTLDGGSNFANHGDSSTFSYLPTAESIEAVSVITMDNAVTINHPPSPWVITRPGSAQSGKILSKPGSFLDSEHVKNASIGIQMPNDLDIGLSEPRPTDDYESLSKFKSKSADPLISLRKSTPKSKSKSHSSIRNESRVKSRVLK
jgi:hypothetical protein